MVPSFGRGVTDPSRPGLSPVHGGPMVAVDTHLVHGCGLPCVFRFGAAFERGLGHILTWDDYMG